jgi:hypothetical protein
VSEDGYIFHAISDGETFKNSRDYYNCRMCAIYSQFILVAANGLKITMVVDFGGLK